MGILRLPNTINKIKNSLNGLNGRIDMTNRFSGLDNKKILSNLNNR